jgi:hypothetical protein
MRELTLAVVGIDFPNADGSNRRSEAMMTLPGTPVSLVPEPRNSHDANAVAVIGSRGVQIGYLSAERAPYVGGRLRRGEAVTAIFQGMDRGAAFIRVRFGGGIPTLPPSDRPSGPTGSFDRAPDDPPPFYPDEDGPEWGA